MTSRTSRETADPAPARASAGPRPPASARRAFTLIELILVMALLTISMAIAFPALRRFFEGRTLDSEARRVLALTRHGQTRATAEGVPMVLWIDDRSGAYGLSMAAGLLEEDPREKEFQLDPDLEFEISPEMERRRDERILTATTTVVRHNQLPTRGRRQTMVPRGAPMIRLLPDGTIADTSPEYVAIRERENRDRALWVVQSTNRLVYELRDAPPDPRRH